MWEKVEGEAEGAEAVPARLNEAMKTRKVLRCTGAAKAGSQADLLAVLFHHLQARCSGKVTCLSEPQFPHLLSGNNNADPRM